MISGIALLTLCMLANMPTGSSYCYQYTPSNLTAMSGTIKFDGLLNVNCTWHLPEVPSNDSALIYFLVSMDVMKDYDNIGIHAGCLIYPGGFFCADYQPLCLIGRVAKYFSSSGTCSTNDMTQRAQDLDQNCTNVEELLPLPRGPKTIRFNAMPTSDYIKMLHPDAPDYHKVSMSLKYEVVDCAPRSSGVTTPKNEVTTSDGTSVMTKGAIVLGSVLALLPIWISA